MTISEADIAAVVLGCFRAGGKLMIVGNGGSAADAQHIAAEFIGRYRIKRKPLPAIAIGADAASLTAIGNDFGFGFVFERPLAALGKAGDVLWALSTSGMSENIVRAVQWANANGALAIGFTGKRESDLRALCRCLVIDSDDPGLIQQGTMAAAHRICGLVEKDIVDALDR